MNFVRMFKFFLLVFSLTKERKESLSGTGHSFQTYLKLHHAAPLPYDIYIVNCKHSVVDDDVKTYDVLITFAIRGLG